ncbi:MAG: ATP-dependent DNA helicase RecG [Candidatus Absconditabacterales bacterium]|nr:ATP-dependent DNA helicase RecG [Candidatus Absconditabacterales bacterium]
MINFKKTLKTNDRYIKILQKNGINSLKDFLQYFPRDYEDRENLVTLDQINVLDKTISSVKGFITDKRFFQRGTKKIYSIKFTDEKGNKGEITIYNSAFLASKININSWYIIIAKPYFKFGKFIFSNPEIRETESFNKDLKEQTSFSFGRIYPIYSELSGIKASWFAQKIWNVLPEIENLFVEYLPQDFLKKFNLLGIKDTIKNLHYPDDIDSIRQGKYRIFFDKLLRIQLHSIINRNEYRQNNDLLNKSQEDRAIIKTIVDRLEFQLTGAQKKVVKKIIEDIHSGKPMMRLLQGDVGSGKTVVAAIVAFYVYKKFGAQSVFLAPLEVLANQHYKTLAKLLLPLGLRIEILKGSLTQGQKDKVKSDLKDGKIHILVGTHAVLQDDVEFKDLKFAIIDEQHKFGVKQRAVFHKFANPHILQMSATPIPRSMALAFFGEFDVSVIDEMPKGRKEIYTKIISESEFVKLKPWILTRIMQKQKIFIVTPLIEESEKMENLKAATVEFENIKSLFFEIKDKIGLLHGKMKSTEKDEVMKGFQGDKYDILVSTTVIEVGVDVPQATVMLIKNAERFGLSQLHQLRGRIGRSDLQSYCFLETKNKSGDSYKRLKAMEETNDGFKLAELDLENRGAGEILGTMQSGQTDIPLEILMNMKFIDKVREGAEWLLEKYPGLEGLDLLKKYLDEKIVKVLV